jgi:hypothetical protein
MSTFISGKIPSGRPLRAASPEPNPLRALLPAAAQRRTLRRQGRGRHHQETATIAR